MSGIFVSYRRETGGGWAGRIHDRLAQQFDADQIFMDVDDIPAAVDFSAFISKQLRTVDVQVVVIDPGWATVPDAQGHPRIQDPDDLLRREISTALFLGVKVIPVLVDGATMPAADQLPNDLSKLAGLNALELSATRFDADIDLLAKAIEPLLADSDENPSGKLGRPLSIALLVGAGVAIGALVLLFIVFPDSDDDVASITTVPETTTTTEALPPGVFLNPANGSFYEAVTVPGGIDWFDAREAAGSSSFRGVQGHLVTITSAQENDFIATNLPEAFTPRPTENDCAGGPRTEPNSCGDPYWLGGFQPTGSPPDEPAGDWQWITGEPFDYTNWADGQPNDFAGREEDCLFPHHDLTPAWNDAQCDDRRVGGYIVEYSKDASG